MTKPTPNRERQRLTEEAGREKNWQRWGPYLSEREWGTVREDYSADGDAWRYFTHEHALSRAYRWGEDGLLGLCDRECRLCFAIALWNGRDPILKERLFGLTGPEGNHGEDVKECYFYLDSTPTHSWMRALYKYPQAAFPYDALREENRRRTRRDPEFELADAGVFDGNRYFDVFATYAKAAPDDICIEITIANRAPEPATLHVLPTLWFRNTWSWGPTQGDDVPTKPSLALVNSTTVRAEHATLGAFRLELDPAAGVAPTWLFTENESNIARLFGATNASPFVKDAFHAAVIEARTDVVNPAHVGTKCAAQHVLTFQAGEEKRLRLRLYGETPPPNNPPEASRFGSAFDATFEERRREADEFYGAVLHKVVANHGAADAGSNVDGLPSPRDSTVGAVTSPRKNPGNTTNQQGEVTPPTRAAAATKSRSEVTPPRENRDNPTDQRGEVTPPTSQTTELPSGAVHVNERAAIARQAYAGLLWSKQFYHVVIRNWLTGDPAQPAPPPERERGRNHDWKHMFARDVISMPDKWEYPWFAAWDLAFHMLPMARIDPHFAKEQLNLLLREWYLHPSGQIPAYEWNFSDVNPPVHAWACWRVYKISAARGERDRTWLARVFQKLLLNFTWWVNRKDPEGNNVFGGGFLGLDNIGVFDRSQPLPSGGRLEQADATAWMAFYCGTMLSIALELADHDAAYEDIASKFFEHFVSIADAMNRFGGTGLWHEQDGFYYDQVLIEGRTMPLRLRSLVGIIPLFAVEVIEERKIGRLAGFSKRTQWFMQHRRDLAAQISYLERCNGRGAYLLAIPSRERLERMLRYVCAEEEFLAPFGVRSLSRAYRDQPYTLRMNGDTFSASYVPGESDSGLFGGNSNWRGPIWFPANYLLIEALERYHHFYGDSFTVEFPTGSGRRVTLDVIAHELGARLVRLFERNALGERPALRADARFARDPQWRDYLWFHEYFHAETGQGLGANHQTGWTALVARLIENGR